MKAYEIPYDLKTVNNKQAEIHIGIRLAKFVIYFSGNSFCPRPRACLKKAFCNLHTRIPILRDWYNYLRNDVPGSKGRESDANLLAGGFVTLGPAKNMSKKPFFEEK